MAARRGRGDAPEFFRGAASPSIFWPRSDFAAWPARPGEVRMIAEGEPRLVAALTARGGDLLASSPARKHRASELLDLGVRWTRRREGRRYDVIPPQPRRSRWRRGAGITEAVPLLIERGATSRAGTTKAARSGRTRVRRLVLVRTVAHPSRSRALLAAGASVGDVVVPCGYAAVDSLLRERR